MKIFFQLLTTSLFLIACGENQTNSTTTSLSKQSFSAIYDNNTDKDFDVKKDSPDLTVSKSYLHVPSNNLFGNRIIVIDFNVKNEAFDKNISAAFDGKWINATWSGLPNFGPVTGTAYVRYLFSEAGRDSFSLIIHDTIFNQSPSVELKVAQNGNDSYVKIQLRAKDLEPKNKVAFSVSNPKNEIAVEKISADKTANGTILKIDVDVKDLDDRKLFQIECFDCTGGDAAKKTLAFISKDEARAKSGAIFNSEENGREKISLYVQLPNSSLDSLKSLRLTYLAPGYFGTPTHGAYDGVFGTPHTLSLKLGQ
jgi:hypothetical protein